MRRRRSNPRPTRRSWPRLAISSAHWPPCSGPSLPRPWRRSCLLCSRKRCVQSSASAFSSSSTLTQAAGRPSDLRASAIGSLAEVCLGLESSITPFTSTLLTPLLQALHEASTAADWDVKTNAAFALGALIEQSGEDLTERFGAVLSGLRPLFEHVEEEAQGARDNACGAVARMIGRNAGAMPLEQVQWDALISYEGMS